MNMTTKSRNPGTATLDDPRWAAVVARDAKADGQFFYSVRTTGVYCRPSCAARTPHPENVAFHVTAIDAQRAGFRACLRCKPDEPSLAAKHAALVAQVCRMLESSEQLPRLAELAQRAQLSTFHLHRVFKAITGLTPKAYAAAHRAKRMREELGEAPRLGLDLPLDVRGTAFQQRVWKALRTIPLGKTASYRDIAQRIGAPNATRAVAQACASNPLAVAIPCHRVVRSDGALSGYRWGVERKRALLASEAQG